jgi:hypothetical protein
VDAGSVNDTIFLEVKKKKDVREYTPLVIACK